jgi:hypothetical protein
VTHLRKLMLEELERRNYSQSTVRTYLMTIEDIARYFHQPPDALGPEQVRGSASTRPTCSVNESWPRIPSTNESVRCGFSSSRRSRKPGVLTRLRTRSE